MDFFHPVDAQHLAAGLAAELVGAVAGADGNRQRVDLGLAHKVRRLIGVGEQSRVVQHALSAVAVFFTGLAGFQRAQATEFTLHRHAAGVRQVHHLAGGRHVVFVARGRLAVGQQAAVHHHRAKARLNRAKANRWRGAVVLVHADWNLRVHLDRCRDQVAQKGLARVGARARRSLQDHGTVHLVGRLHDGLHLLQVVDVEGRQAVVVLGGVVEQLAKGDEGHGVPWGVVLKIASPFGLSL